MDSTAVLKFVPSSSEFDRYLRPAPNPGRSRCKCGRGLVVPQWTSHPCQVTSCLWTQAARELTIATESSRFTPTLPSQSSLRSPRSRPKETLNSGRLDLRKPTSSLKLAKHVVGKEPRRQGPKGLNNLGADSNGSRSTSDRCPRSEVRQPQDHKRRFSSGSFRSQQAAGSSEATASASEDRGQTRQG